MYINAQELFDIAGIKAEPEMIDKINDRFYIRNKVVQLGSIEALEEIVKKVAQVNEISHSEMVDISRKRHLVDARSEATFLLAILGYRDCEIKKAFNKDHSTINYYRDRIKDQMSINFKYKSDFYKKYAHILESFQIANKTELN